MSEVDADARKAAELAAMNVVMKIERRAGFAPRDVSKQNLGYDIESGGRLIEVKGRRADAETVTISRNEIQCALNNSDKFILALVRLDGDKTSTTYLKEPFELPPAGAALSVNFSIEELLRCGKKIRP